MINQRRVFTSQQLVFQELFIGTFVYASVLGFFNDYTSVVEAKSFSTIFFASLLLELLTFGAFKLKSAVVSQLKHEQGAIYRALTVLVVWLIMFLSKFVFIWALGAVFGNYIQVNGFFGILAVVLSVTIVHKGAYKIFSLLGESK